MKAALLIGTLGTLLSLWVGGEYFGLSYGGSLWTVFVANCAGLVGLVLTLRAESIPALKKKWLNSGLKTWALIAALYLSMMVTFAPVMRSGLTLLGMFLPNLLSSGYSFLVFGPIQDRIYRRAQRKHRTRS